jgi:hypothetical protein
MPHRSPVLGVIAVSGLLVLAATARAQALDTLVKNSPFGSATAAGTPASPGGALEFRGMFVDGGETFFSLYDAATRTSLWVGLKEAGNPFVVKSYDETKGTVSVDYQGQVHTITLKQAKIVALAPPPSPLPTQAATSPGAPPAVNASPDEAARLAQIAEEIRRRRAIRAQAGAPRSPVPPPSVPSPATAVTPAPNRP